MATMIYAIAAAVGGTFLLCQFVMTLFGLGGHEMPHDMPDDVPHDFHFGHAEGHAASHDHDSNDDHHDSSWFFRMISFRTLVAALTFFGLAGLAGSSAELPATSVLVIALAAGAAAMYGVHWLMQSLYKLRADGTVRIQRAIGQSATVYLRIPPNKSGVGKVHLNLQNRTMEYEAMTSHELLPVGAKVVVVDVLGPDTVEVEPAVEAERTVHV
jgi:membrane protein implicated in regulation of membrane protease activity